MYNENCVMFKGRKDGLVILLNDEVDFYILKEHLKKKIVDAQKFFQGAKVSITFKGRSLSEEEQFELLEIISKKTTLDISYVHDFDEMEEEGKTSDNITEVIDDKRFQHSITKYYKGTVRSGQSIRFAGSVVVIGDINPGGEVIAEGNIIVLGTLKGMVHAGCIGGQAFIVALEMIPMQIRIGEVITRFPDNSQKKKRNDPEIAYLYNNQVYIEPLDPKALENL